MVVQYVVEFLLNLLLVWGPKAYVFWQFNSNRESLSLRKRLYKVNAITSAISLVVSLISLIVDTVITAKTN